MLRTIGLFALVAIGIVTLQPQETKSTTDPSAMPEASSAPAVAALPNAQVTAGPSLIARSPFSPTRGPYSRDAPPRPGADTPIDVRLVGISKIGSQYRATLLINGSEFRVAPNQNTPVGPVVSIDGSSVTLGGASPQTITLFPQ